MSSIIAMITAAVCYTITSLSDKYAIAKAHFQRNDFTFLMCASMSVFLICSLPFQKVYFIISWQSFTAVLLIAVCKYTEFEMSALVLEQISAFELKAWLGITLIASYFTDVFLGEELQIARLICIVITLVGLILIVKSDTSKRINYRKILLPLMLYLISKFGYGIIIKGFTRYASPTMQLLPALIMITFFLLFKVQPKKIFADNPGGAKKVVLARIPNTIGMLAENAAISISLTTYSFIQPMVLVLLFLIGILRKESRSKLNMIGSVLCIVGMVGFQLND